MTDNIEQAMNFLCSAKDDDKTIDEYMDEFIKNGGKIKKLPTIKKKTKQTIKGRAAKRYFKSLNR